MTDWRQRHRGCRSAGHIDLTRLAEGSSMRSGWRFNRISCRIDLQCRAKAGTDVRFCKCSLHKLQPITRRSLCRTSRQDPRSSEPMGWKARRTWSLCSKKVSMKEHYVFNSRCLYTGLERTSSCMSTLSASKDRLSPFSSFLQLSLEVTIPSSIPGFS